MSARRPFDRTLNEWLDEGPMTAPREDLAAVLEAVPQVRQRSRIGREIPMPTMLRYAVAAAIVVLIGGFVLSRIVPTNNGVATAPTPTPSPTPGWADRFPHGTASTFAHPFTYAIDPATNMALGSNDNLSQLFDVVDPTSGNVTSRVVISLVTGVREDVCAASGSAILSKPSPRQLVDYLKTLPGHRAVEGKPTTVDGREALVVDVTQLPAASRPCQDEYVWANNDTPFTSIADGATRRIVAFDVGGDTVAAIEIGPMPEWTATASAFLDSLDFGSSASPRPSAP